MQCRFKHTRLTGRPPAPERLEAAKPKEFRNINIVANQANEGILPEDVHRRPLRLGEMAPSDALQLPSSDNQQLLAAVGQRDLRYGF